MAIYTTAPLQILPVGTKISINLTDASPFPPYSTIYATSNNSSNLGFYATVLSQDTTDQILNVQMGQTVNGYYGATMPVSSVIVSAGVPGPAGTVTVGSPGTSLEKDLIFAGASFNSENGLSSYATIANLTYILPNSFLTISNGLNPNWRVIVELNASLLSNQLLSNNAAYIGIGTTNTGSNGIGILSGLSGTSPAPIIPTSSCVSDIPILVASSTTPGEPTSVKYIATYAAGTQLQFSVLASAIQTNTTFWVNGFLTLSLYPIYQT